MEKQKASFNYFVAMKVLILLFLVLFSACSVQKRCERHIRKAKTFGCLKIDTLTLRDTFKGFSVDTFFQFDTLNKIDSFTFVKDNFSVKTLINWKTRIIKQNLTKKDTIIVKKVEQKTVFLRNNKINFATKLLILLLSCIIVVLIFKK
jgi:predicted Abi (CAAX) family protease